MTHYYSVLTSLHFFSGGTHGRYLLTGQSLERFGNEVGVRGDHLLPAAGLHHVGDVASVDVFDGLQKAQVNREQLRMELSFYKKKQ